MARTRVDEAHERMQFSHFGLAMVLRDHRTQELEPIEQNIRDLTAGGLEPEFSEFLSKGASWIETGSAGFVNLTLSQLATVAQLWSAPLTRLFACAPEADSDLFIRVAKDDHRRLHSSSWPSVAGSPRDAEYRFPTTRLVNTGDVEVGQLVIESGGFSECHGHHGDEVIIVRRGTVELTLLGTDIRSRLSEGDVAHFYAEQRHIVHHVEGPEAEILIVRHITPAGGDALRVRSLASVQKKYSAAGFQRLVEELRSTLSFDISSGEEVPESTRDRMGLGFFLERLSRTKGYGGTVDELASRSASLADAEKRAGFNKSRLSRLQLGEVALSRVDIPHLAEVYKVPRILLYEFLFPAYRNVIVIRGSDGLQPVGSVFLEDVVAGAHYETPVRRLVTFGVSMSRVTLPSRSRINEHQHPGHELLVPTTGSLTINFAGGMDSQLSARDHAYAHFHSDRTHSMENGTDEEAVFWVFRFF